MSDESELSLRTPANYQRTTGGNLQWTPPSAEHLQDLLPGYDVIGMLGAGGMGAVYKAQQRSLDRTVAIKILPPEVDDEDGSFSERFKNEARTMARMNHAAIVQVYDFGEMREGQLYIIMEFVDGTDVSKMIQAEGRLPPEHALAITAHVCDALQYAHTHGIIHRDIKPANILINMEGAVKVADFGLAKAAEAGPGGLTKADMAMGTPDFVAPEALITGMDVDGRADLYAVGVMLYNMLTGNVPRGVFRMPSTTLATDPRFDQIIAKAMEMDRDRRYQTAHDIRAELDVILTTPRVVAGAPGRPAVPRRDLPHKPEARRPQRPSFERGVHVGHAVAVNPRSTGAAVQPKNKGVALAAGLAAAFAGAGLFFAFKLDPAWRSSDSPDQVAQQPSLAARTQQGPGADSPAASGATERLTFAEKRKRASPVKAAEQNQDGAAEKWVKLFDGKTFSGWTAPGQSHPAPVWQMKDDEVSTKERSVLISPRDYENFELALDWKVGAGGNGGVFYHVQGSNWNSALELQLCDPSNSGMTKTGGIYALMPPERHKSKPVGEWNTSRLVVKGTAREHWINDELVCRYDISSPDFKRLLLSAGKKNFDLSHAGGKILLQGNGGPVYYRNIRIRTLQVEPMVSGALEAPAKSSDGAINLLALVQVARDKVDGDWKMVDGELHGSGAYARLAFNYAVPAEYDFRIAFTRKAGNNAVSQHLVHGSHDVMWLMGGFGNSALGLETIGELKGNNNATTLKQALNNNQRYEGVVKVRRDRIQAELDGKMVLDHKTDGSDLGVGDLWRYPEKDQLGVGCQQATVFHRIELAPLVSPAGVSGETLASSKPVAPVISTSAPAGASTATTLSLSASTASDPRLVKLAAGFKMRYETDAQNPFEAALAALNQSYVVNGIGKARSSAQLRGALEEVRALDAEKSRVTNREPLPGADLDTLPQSLKALRSVYRGAVAKLEADRRQKAAPLYDLYLSALDGYIGELTKGNQLDPAKNVTALRELIATQKATLLGTPAHAGEEPAAATPGGDKVAPVVVR